MTTKTVRATVTCVFDIETEVVEGEDPMPRLRKIANSYVAGVGMNESHDIHDLRVVEAE